MKKYILSKVKDDTTVNADTTYRTIITAFKKTFLEYIQQYWIDGQVPPQAWNCFSRKVDLTNNNNGTHNNYLNSALKETHPSPANFTIAIVKELTLAETKWRQVKSGKERKVKKTFQKMNRKRTNLKKIYSSLDRIEYLAKMGNIVRHIHLNKGQMAELAKKKVSQEVDGQQEVFDDALNMSLTRMQSNVLQLLKMIQKGGQIHLTLLSLW